MVTMDNGIATRKLRRVLLNCVDKKRNGDKKCRNEPSPLKKKMNPPPPPPKKKLLQTQQTNTQPNKNNQYTITKKGAYKSPLPFDKSLFPGNNSSKSMRWVII